MNKPKVIALLLLSIVVLIVVMQNTEPVQTRVLFATIEMSRALLLAVTFAVGSLAGLGVGVWIARGRNASDNDSKS